MMKYSYYKYIVVEFDDEGIQIIPRNWLINNCSATKFPPLTTNNIRYEKFCTKMVEPKDNFLFKKNSCVLWFVFQYFIYKHSFTEKYILCQLFVCIDDFPAAKKKLKKA